ncbi:MAG: restriction endonuclease [Anaerolineae bacterium]|nr:restriction endonuclease [Anaerolineae bacterium]
MTVPDYQTLMLPVLQVAQDGIEHTISDVVQILADTFQLSVEDRSELLPSGRQFRFDNRVHWARSYLKQAGLLQNTGRGKFRITERGVGALENNPGYINQVFLQQFPEFLEFKNRTGKSDTAVEEIEPEATQTPEEILEASYQSLRNKLAQEILERIMSCSPRFFERLVVDLLVRMGYGGSRKDAGRAIGQSGDGGVDGIINEDRLGLDVVYIQAKRWEGTVGRPVVQAFAGSLEGFRAKKGVMITTSSFSKDAIDYVGRIEKKIVLIDGEQLAQYMIDYGVGVAEMVTYTVKRIDLDYFDEE